MPIGQIGKQRPKSLGGPEGHMYILHPQLPADKPAPSEVDLADMPSEAKP